jgi:hypothetical protein
VNIILDTKSRTYKKTTHKIEEKSNEKIFGFAVKLSTLDKYQISMSTVLKGTNNIIIIDAEFERLDHWVINQLKLGIMNSDDLKRVLITVQAKRIDANDQLNNLEKIGIRVVLVSGHQDYLSQEEISRPGVELLATYYQKYNNIEYLGISAKVHKKLSKKLDYRINDNVVLELYGEHKLMKSGLWAYFGGTELSIEAKNYLNRRKENGKDLSFIKILSLYFIQSKSQLKYYNETRSIFVCLDIINKKKYIETLKELIE